MSVLHDYANAAAAVLTTARMLALRVGVADRSRERIETLYEAIEELMARQVYARLGKRDNEEKRVMLAGIVAAHAMHRRLVVSEDEHAEAVGEALPALWESDMQRRLEAARLLGPSRAGYMGEARRVLGVLLRQQPGSSQATAAAGQLARAVIKQGGAGLAHAWYVVFGEYLLVTRPVQRAAAVARMQTGVLGAKMAVHQLSGISRPTLDGWLDAAQGGGATTD